MKESADKVDEVMSLTCPASRKTVCEKDVPARARAQQHHGLGKSWEEVVEHGEDVLASHGGCVGKRRIRRM